MLPTPSPILPIATRLSYLLLLLHNQLLEPSNLLLKGRNLSVKLRLATMGLTLSVNVILDVWKMMTLLDWVFAAVRIGAAIVVVYIVKVAAMTCAVPLQDWA